MCARHITVIRVASKTHPGDLARDITCFTVQQTESNECSAMSTRRHTPAPLLSAQELAVGAVEHSAAHFGGEVREGVERGGGEHVRDGERGDHSILIAALKSERATRHTLRLLSIGRLTENPATEASAQVQRRGSRRGGQVVEDLMCAQQSMTEVWCAHAARASASPARATSVSRNDVLMSSAGRVTCAMAARGFAWKKHVSTNNSR